MIRSKSFLCRNLTVASVTDKNEFMQQERERELQYFARHPDTKKSDEEGIDAYY